MTRLNTSRPERRTLGGGARCSERPYRADHLPTRRLHTGGTLESMPSFPARCRTSRIPSHKACTPQHRRCSSAWQTCCFDPASRRKSYRKQRSRLQSGPYVRARPCPRPPESRSDETLCCTPLRSRHRCRRRLSTSRLADGHARRGRPPGHFRARSPGPVRSSRTAAVFDELASGPHVDTLPEIHLG